MTAAPAPRRAASRVLLRRVVAGTLACALALAATAARAEGILSGVPEPDDYRRDAYRTPTPATLRGATVLTTGGAEALWRSGAAAFVDVLPQPGRPAGLPPGTLWRQPPHDSLPGAVWLANVGFGDLAPETEAYFRRGLDAATGGDRARPVVLFCLRDCWMSWNAAKRALAWGFERVHWYPEGVDGWREAGLPVQRLEPAP